MEGIKKEKALFFDDGNCITAVPVLGVSNNPMLRSIGWGIIKGTLTLTWVVDQYLTTLLDIVAQSAYTHSIHESLFKNTGETEIKPIIRTSSGLESKAESISTGS